MIGSKARPQIVFGRVRKAAPPPRCCRISVRFGGELLEGGGGGFGCHFDCALGLGILGLGDVFVFVEAEYLQYLPTTFICSAFARLLLLLLSLVSVPPLSSGRSSCLLDYLLYNS